MKNLGIYGLLAQMVKIALQRLFQKYAQVLLNSDVLFILKTI